jgi:DNA-binding CsgD family transcriptional regulator
VAERRLIWLRAAAYGLSLREREVVDFVAAGASTKQISQYTVQDHLSNIFDKIGVRNRRALVKRLFLDNLHPAMFE